MKIPYYNRLDLTNDEIHAISCYQDLVNPQSQWEYPIPKDKSVGKDCYMINQYMRNLINLSENDTLQVE